MRAVALLLASRGFATEARHVVIVGKAFDPAALDYGHRYAAYGRVQAHHMSTGRAQIAGERGGPGPFRSYDPARRDHIRQPPTIVRLAGDHVTHQSLDLLNSLTPQFPRDVFVNRVRSEQRIERC